jgi:integrase/recombinase XerD
MLFDWLVTGQVVPRNLAHSVRGVRHSVSKSVTPVLSSEEAAALLAGMHVSSVVGLCDRAIMAVMIYTFARVGTVVALNLEDYFPQKNAGGSSAQEKWQAQRDALSSQAKSLSRCLYRHGRYYRWPQGAAVPCLGQE